LKAVTGFSAFNPGFDAFPPEKQFAAQFKRGDIVEILADDFPVNPQEISQFFEIENRAELDPAAKSGPLMDSGGGVEHACYAWRVAGQGRSFRCHGVHQFLFLLAGGAFCQMGFDFCGRGLGQLMIAVF
jgi:hypothetical protein